MVAGSDVILTSARDQPLRADFVWHDEIEFLVNSFN